jgi:hypothetical protein
MSPKTPDEKQPKKKPTTTKKTPPSGNTGTKAISKGASSTSTKRTAQSQEKNPDPQLSYPGSSMALSEELRERIAQRAYEIHHRRGGQHGSDWEDWLQAEREILLQQPPPAS